MISKYKLRKLYERYGYEWFWDVPETDSYMAFTVRCGLNDYLDLVVLTNRTEDRTNAEIAKRNLLEEYDFAEVKISQYADCEEAEQALFTAFFKPEEYEKALKADFKTYGGVEIKDHNCKLVKGMVKRSMETEFCDDGYGNVISIVENKSKDIPSLYVATDIAYGSWSEKTMPLVVDLAKNKAARLFRYILEDEIARKLRGIKYECLREEIKNGRIPVIITGLEYMFSDHGKMLPDAKENMRALLFSLTNVAVKHGSKTKLVFITENPTYTYLLLHFVEDYFAEDAKIQTEVSTGTFSLKQWHI